MNKPAAWSEVVAGLQADGSLSATASPPAPDIALPWPVMVLQTIAAWIAAILLVAAFVVPATMGHSQAGFIIVGVLFATGAGFVLRQGASFFLDQAAVPVAIAGAVLIGIGLEPRQHVDLLIFVLAAGGFAMSSHGLLRFIAAGTLFGVIWYWLSPLYWHDWYDDPVAPTMLPVWFALVRNVLFGLGLWWLWARQPRPASIWAPTRLALLAVAVATTQDWEAWMMGGAWRGILLAGGLWPAWYWLVRLLALLPLALAVADTLRADRELAHPLLPLLLLAPLCLLSPAMAVSGLLIWLGLAQGRALLLGLGVANALLGFGHFYYSMAWPLLYKGLGLLLLATILLGSWLALRRSD
ncbi:protein of unknown function [Andreprevotia lacus DSM 23236]|jgi:hypothetical protein|uniref:DUF4401 domain-containing protein n=1 Tax=Andreprevotia lacus DSM 23236 TaxID=1121001 RepID=A0A1W1XHB1_9NEIS|nr:DUF4401 domain-containing protein [Andreprevotia lacus]SMC23164.1 protein of unknown function [Andreprevotia lacus DSM 23236]